MRSSAAVRRRRHVVLTPPASTSSAPCPSSWARRTVLESEPQDLRISGKRPLLSDMEQTNGCASDGGPLALSVSNHSDVSQGEKGEKQPPKLLLGQNKKMSKAASVSSKNRSRRKPVLETPNSFSSTTLHLPEKRATRHVTALPSKTLSESKSSNSQTIPAITSSHTNKKLLHPPTLSPQVPCSSSEDCHEIPVVRHNKRLHPTIACSSPPLLISQKRCPKRVPPPPPPATESDESSSPRSSKRIRLQHQPFQSPPPPAIIPAILRQPQIKTPEDKICVFQKGEFLAVRNENGSFFVCRTAQNVYKSSKRFKIQWMSDQEPDIYIPDFYDQTDFECVLTNLRMKRVDKNKYRLPGDERQRTLNILQRALNIENGIDISKFQVTTDGVDVSIVGKEEEVLRLQAQHNLLSNQGSKVPQMRSRGRPRQAKMRVSPKTSPPAPSTVMVPKKVKTLAARVKLRSRETVKVKLKKEGEKIIVSNKGGKPAVPKLKNDIERLHPNSKVTSYEKDPTFEMNVPIPYVSSSAHSKLLTRAILLKDIDMLTSLMKDTQRICSLDCFRGVDIQLTPLAYAVLEEDHRAIKSLLTASRRKYANPPETLLECQSNQRPNITMSGFEFRCPHVSRGGREGNNAFLKDLKFCDSTYPHVDHSLIKQALSAGVSLETLKILCSEGSQHCTSWQSDVVLQHIVVAVRHGHHTLAGQLITEAVGRGGYGFGNLHKEVLVKERQQLSQFRTISVTKKASGRTNARITPLHCAAINPNPQYLTALLSVCPEYTLADENGWRPIHYAAVCQSTGPLELLIARGISMDDVENEGNTCLHVASLSGRAHNVDLILRHLKVTDHSKKDTDTDITALDKVNVGMIDRGNKKSFTPLHLACQNGHTDVVRVLLKHNANIDKQTNAQHEKLTALMLASQKGHLGIVIRLIESMARVELKDKKQRTALTHAVINGHAHISSYLLRLGANPNSTDSSGNTLVHYAAAYGWYFCLKLLVEAGASLNLPNDWKITPLSLAFMKGHMGLVDFLVEQPGIDINVDVHNDSGMTLVMQALRSKINHSMLERIHFLVVKQNSDCAKIDFMGNNALHHLVLAEVEEMKREHELQSHSSSRDREDEEQMTEESCKPTNNWSFMEEAQQEHDALVQEIAKLLLDHGCDPMIKNKEGESPFNMAVKEGCLLLVKLFLDAGCQLVLEVSTSGDNILHYLVSHACSRKVEPMLQAILNAKCSDNSSTPHQLLCQMARMYNKKGHTPLLQALSALKSYNEDECKNRLLSFSKFLIDELGADVAAPCQGTGGKPECYALHLAALCEGGNVIEALLSHKAPLNSLNNEGQTPLIVAIKEENVEAIEALIRAGAMVNTKSTQDGSLSPLLLASKSPKLGKVIQFLVHNKADVNDVDPTNKNTALHYVVSLRASDVLETAKALLTAGANVNAMNEKKRTPLHLAVNASSSDSDASYAVEECLIGFGAKTDSVDCRGRTPLFYAFTKIGRHTDRCAIDPVELVVLLVDAMPSAAVELADNFGQTILHAAAYRGATISSMHITKHMSDLDVKDKNGNTALGLAVKNGHESCTLMLLKHGASCVSDLTVTREENGSMVVANNLKYWEWSHVARKPQLLKKHTVLQETLQQGWQGILYLMLDQLEVMGKGINIAVEAALRAAKYNVALKLIGKVKHGWTLYNEKQNMLHVLAREAPGNYLPDLQVKVAQFLIEKTVPFMARDEHGCSALTYAAINWNYALCTFFCMKTSITAAAQADVDRSFRSPLSAVFWKLNHEDLPEDMRNWCISLIKSGGNLNVLTRYPVRESPFPGVPCVTVDDVLHIEDGSLSKISPLIMAIRKQNYSVVKFLISQGADINFPDENRRTPLMHAAAMNDIRMVKLLMNSSYEPQKDKTPFHDGETANFQKTSSLSLSGHDVNGWTVVHHLICPLPDYCYADCTLLRLLAKFGAPLETPNNDGESPLNMALKLKHEPVILVLQELLNLPLNGRVTLETSLNFPSGNKDVVFEKPLWDYKADSESALCKVFESHNETDVDQLQNFPPHHLSGLEENGEVVMDSSKDIPYDVLMTVVDLNYGAYGIYNFYKMQIIKHKVKELFVLFTSWGRVGYVGQHQKTPFVNVNEATKEFCRIFRAKTGNHWDDVLNFQPQTKKYRLVQFEKRKQMSRRKSIKLDLCYNVPSNLEELQQKLMKNLMMIRVFEESLRDLGINAAFEDIPFGKLKESSFADAHKLLQEIGAIINERDSLQQNFKSQDKFSELMYKIVKLSEDFYQLLPIYGSQYELLCPLFCTSDVHEKLVLLDHLQHISLASRMLFAAHFKMNEINPMDYVYKSLSCHLLQLDKDAQEAQMILQYIHNTSLQHKINVECIYKIIQPQEQSSEKSHLSMQRHLLWHGTRLSNVLSVLTKGLQSSPLHVPISGNLFGKGIYLSDMFVKSLSYCQSEPITHRKCMFLCEADLCEMREVESNVVVDFKEKCDSVKVLGHRQPDPAGCISWKGVRVPLGYPVNVLEQGASTQHHFLDFNEYIIYESSKVCLRYLIQFNCDSGVM